MTLFSLLAECSAADVRLTLAGGQITVDGPRGALTAPSKELAVGEAGGGSLWVDPIWDWAEGLLWVPPAEHRKPIPP